jgi:hypothetical protein
VEAGCHLSANAAIPLSEWIKRFPAKTLGPDLFDAIHPAKPGWKKKGRLR